MEPIGAKILFIYFLIFKHVLCFPQWKFLSKVLWHSGCSDRCKSEWLLCCLSVVWPREMHFVGLSLLSGKAGVTIQRFVVNVCVFLAFPRPYLCSFYFLSLDVSEGYAEPQIGSKEAGESAICADTITKTRESSLSVASMKTDIYNKLKENALRIKIFIK